ncbi:MAG TPA: SUMF1/EgtB/PvdO family nonheme iron enzyme [Vicinamibacterales bacterium]|nr:SUMF1/EgtB/PvdO family nonheme iron enzyme [Vicinamibacterales bacterium]
MAMTPGSRLGRYAILSPLGAGGMAEVYVAEDTELGRRVALKILPPDTTSDEHARKRLLREARAAATLDHPHICAIYDVGEEQGQRFIAMQLVEGETLDARLKRSQLEWREILTIATDIADALAAAHARGIVHRDVKPSNVMVTPRGHAVVLDFGLAKLVEEASTVDAATATQSLLSSPGAVIGTLPYMSPEQVRGDALDARTDIFSLGVLLYESVSGRRPFVEKNSAATASAILTGEPPPLPGLRSDAPPELVRIIGKCLRKDAADRYQTADDLLVDLRTLRDEHEFQRRLGRSASASSGVAAAAPALERSRLWPIAAAAFVIAAGLGGWYAWRASAASAARDSLPQISRLADEGRFFEAYDLAVQAERSLGTDPTLAGLMGRVAVTIAVKSEPAGAQVFLKPFRLDASGNLPARQLAGVTPIESLRVARGEYVLAIEKEGYAPVERTISSAYLHAGRLFVSPPPADITQRLIAATDMPAGMVLVPGGGYRLVGSSRPTDRRVELQDYFIDKYEVSNRDFREFIAAGGYLKPEYWRHPFVDERGGVAPWETAIKRFVDRTGLPGPRGWSDQQVPEGKADHPVTDVSWYEAAAYAAFRGKVLPTVFQWEKAARNGMQTGIVNYMPWGAFYPGNTLAHHANFANNGTAPVTSMEFGMSPFGAYHMAGNVAEWTLNDTSEGRLATGGAFGDPTYTFSQFPMLPGFYSSNKIGFRCAMNAPGRTGDQGSERIEITDEIPTYTASAVKDFRTWARAYDYPQIPLDIRIEEVKETPDWRREKITYVGSGSAGDRAIIYLYLPPHHARPLQVIHLVPAGDVAGGLRPLADSMEDRLAPFIRSGRAAFGVVLRGYSERLGAPANPIDLRTVEYLDFIVGRVTDLRRALDYMQTRADLDMTRLAFFGPSAGAQLGLILAAVEPRYRAVALVGGGLAKGLESVKAEANPINFAAHINRPTLMLHGIYDEDTPLRSHAEPLYKLLPGPKTLVTYPGGHVPPSELQFSTLSAWLDEIVGPVRR